MGVEIVIVSKFQNDQLSMADAVWMARDVKSYARVQTSPN
jgi:hypothetical protein